MGFHANLYTAEDLINKLGHAKRKMHPAAAASYLRVHVYDCVFVSFLLLLVISAGLPRKFWRYFCVYVCVWLWKCVPFAVARVCLCVCMCV